MLRDYGMNLGIAFQLIDDLLDFTSSQDVLGKPAGADLVEGKVSLPLIFLLAARAAFAARSSNRHQRSADTTALPEKSYKPLWCEPARCNSRRPGD